jgi:hypothetical protein
MAASRRVNAIAIMLTQMFSFYASGVGARGKLYDLFCADSRETGANCRRSLPMKFMAPSTVAIKNKFL